MKCPICKQGETSTGSATVVLERDGTTLVFKKVPADICANCGEEYIGEAITRSLLDQASEAARQGVELDVRHFLTA